MNGRAVGCVDAEMRSRAGRIRTGIFPRPDFAFEPDEAAAIQSDGNVRVRKATVPVSRRTISRRRACPDFQNRRRAVGCLTASSFGIADGDGILKRHFLTSNPKCSDLHRGQSHGHCRQH